MQQMSIHSHGCADITDGKDCLLFDPWLVGSAYWRSWWNFPEPTPVDELCERLETYRCIYIYITHLHWDHFHGPTIRALCKRLKNIHFVIPRVPEPRLFRDLRDVIGSQIQISEIGHGDSFSINSEFSVRIFLSGVFVTDSAALVTIGKCQVLNLNDSKPQKRLCKLISRYITTDKLITLRSHSSANARSCRRTRQGDAPEVPQDNTDNYSKQFVEAARVFNSHVAIPYASNMCYLHEDTFGYNALSNTADLVEEYADKTGYEKVQLVLPKESINLQTFEVTLNRASRSQLFEERDQALSHYRRVKLKTLLSEQRASLNVFATKNLVHAYFNHLFRSIPWFLAFLMRYRVSYSPDFEFISERSFTVDISKRKVLWDRKSYQSSKVNIVVPGHVLASIMRVKNFDSLGISKRLYICADSYWYYRIFLALLVYSDIGIFPLTRNSFKRLVSSWLNRMPELGDNLELFFRKLAIRYFQ